MQVKRSISKSKLQQTVQVSQKPRGSTKPLPNGIRSSLSTACIIKWLRTRYNNKCRGNMHYLYFPQQLMRETSMQQIFLQFDSDGSGGLSRDQVFDMFNGFGIQITMEHLDRLYDSVEVNLEELDCNKFKKCAMGQSSNRVFRQIVREIEQQDLYLPHNFTNMIIYLVYLSKRDELRKKIAFSQTPIQRKVQKLDTLLKLKDLGLNNQRLHIHSDVLKKNLKNKFRDIWQRLNQRYGQKFPHTPKTQQQFYKFCVQKGIVKKTTSSLTPNISK